MPVSFIRIETQQTQPNYPLNRPVIVVSPINVSATLDVDVNGNTLVDFSNLPVTLPTTQPIDYLLNVHGNPAAAGMTYLLRAPIPYQLVFDPNMPGSIGICEFAPLQNVTLTVRQNGNSIGTISFGANQTNAVFASIGIVIFNRSDILQVDAPSPADAVISNLSIVLQGMRIFP